MTEFTAIITADNQRAEMKSEVPRALHKVCAKEIIAWIAETARTAGAVRVFVAPEKETENIGEALSAFGTEILDENSGILKECGLVAVIDGAAPLLTPKTISECLEYHIQTKNRVTVAGAKGTDDASACLCFFSAEELSRQMSGGKSLSAISAISELIKKGKEDGIYTAGECEEFMDIKNRIELSEAESIMQKRIIHAHMKNGVSFILPETTVIESNVQILEDTVIYPGAVIKSGTRIGRGCTVGMNTMIENSKIGDGVNIISSVIIDSEVGEGTNVGPFAYLRPNSKVGKNVKVGDFVEIKNSEVGDGTKISHLTYVGDSDVGRNVNFGCGTVTVNYDGKKKYRTKIGDGCFIGCNTNLVAPVTVEDGGYTAAGSTITDTVPKDSLAIARARQIIKKEWKDRRK